MYITVGLLCVYKCLCVCICLSMFMLEGSRLSRGKSSVGQFSYDAVFQGRVFLGTIIHVRSFSGGNFLETVCLESLIISQVRRSEK